MASSSVIEPPFAGRPGRGASAFIGLALLAGLVFVAGFALPYFSYDERRFGPYWSERFWLLLHITGGMVALLSGPVQLWLGLSDRRMGLHRRLGITYLASVIVSAAAAYYLAFHSPAGWLFGAGLAGLATAWITTTGMAYIAIRRSLYDQHKEWMIRSYVVTFGFVFFRIIYPIAMTVGIGTDVEQLAFAAWSCWALPLVFTEAILQGRKIFCGAMIVFVAGGTGYLGRPLIDQLLDHGHSIRALTRSTADARLPPQTHIVAGNALEAGAWVKHIAPADTFVHLVGTPRPNPSKAREFREVDLASIRAAIDAAARAGVRHFIYVSVAQPAPVMKAYIEVRIEGEAMVRASGLNATILRPWYVLGPGHWWPYALVPVYGILRLIPSTAEGARRLGLVTRAQMIRALVHAVEHPPNGVKIVEVPEIRSPGPKGPGLRA